MTRLILLALDSLRGHRFRSNVCTRCGVIQSYRRVW